MATNVPVTSREMARILLLPADEGSDRESAIDGRQSKAKEIIPTIIDMYHSERREVLQVATEYEQ